MTHSTRLRALLVCAAVIGIVIPDPTVSGQVVNRKGKSFPVVKLSKVAAGPEIETALGGQIVDVADWYGQTVGDFQKLVKRDKHLKADQGGRLHYACHAPVAAGGLSSTWGNTGKTYAAPLPDSQTFQLHSKPGASKVIYLDFNGHTTSGTYWNSSYNGGANFATPSYDIDGNAGSFSSQEMANIQVIWQSVAEDFASYDVDVTTQDPGIEALRKTSAGDLSFGIRVCVGGSSMDWLGQSSGGVAYLDSFNWNSDTPAFVFPAQLGAGNPKFVAEAVSHEAGHTFGLHHHGLNNGTEYYSGQGNWAPIMGASYYVDVTQWSMGEYNGANNQEDQLSLIASHVPYRADLVGGNISQATALTGSTLSTSGTIETTNEVDVYSFTTGSGNIALTARAAPPASGNLNLLLSLYNASGAAITTAGPSASSVGVSINTSVPAGTYYVAINGVGSGDPYDTGFSSYGSVGQYSITGSVVPTGNKAPVAMVSNSAPLTGYASLNVNFSSAGSSDPDGTVASYSWNFGDGTSSTLANPPHTYTNAGSYTATLVVRDNYGTASPPKSVTITVQNNLPPVAVAAVAAPQSIVAGQAANFSSAGSSDPDGTIVSYAWLFGDGTVSTQANPSHVYANPGTYTATLRVTDNAGAESAPVSVTVTVQVPPNVAPIAVASNSAPLSISVGQAVNFSSTGSSDPDGTIAGYSWNFGDGSAVSTSANTPHTYNVVGSYNATLTVTDNRGLSSTSTVVVQVSAAKVINVDNIAMRTTFASGKYKAVATVTVVNPNTGSPISGVAVKGNWSGVVSATGATATTDAAGKAVLTSASTATAGAFTFTVTGLTLTGYSYDATKNRISSASVTPPPNVLSVSSIAMSTTFASGKYTAKATVTVVNPNTGSPISGVAVKGNWSGATSAVGVTATTGTNGAAILTSASTTVAGTFTFTVTGLTLSGYTYDATKNTASSASVIPPPNVLSVSGIAMSTTFASSLYTAKATVIVVNPITGSPISGVAVKGNWSGAVSATGVTATTDATGKAVLTSASTATPGTFTFTVTGLTLAGYTYDATKNTVSSASVIPPPNVLSVSSIAMSTALRRGVYTTKATVTVVNPYSGAPIPGAVVKGDWSGVVSATGVTATSGTTGAAVLTSASTTTKGSYTFTVTGITLAGYTYDATRNTLTANSITPP